MSCTLLATKASPIRHETSALQILLPFGCRCSAEPCMAPVLPEAGVTCATSASAQSSPRGGPALRQPSAETVHRGEPGSHDVGEFCGV